MPDPDPAPPLTDADLGWLEVWAANGAAMLLFAHVPALVAEIRRLRAELAATREVKRLLAVENSDLRAELEACARTGLPPA